MSGSGKPLASLGATLAAILFVTRTVSAQEPEPGFGEKYRFILALENVGGVMHERLQVEDNDDTHRTQVGLFTGGLINPATTGANMRLGLHYFVAPPLSLGGLLSYADHDEGGEYLQVGARVGVAFSLSPATALWLRAGVVYVHTSREVSSELDVASSNVVPGGELYLVLRPAQHFGVLLGPSFDIGVAGKTDGGTGDVDFDYMSYGLSFGVLGDF